MSLRFKVLALAVLLALEAVEPSAQQPTLKAAMREKLANTQQLLEAVIRADYVGMQVDTERLSRITYTEIASWQEVAQPDYVRQATIFLSSVQALREAAEQKNLEAASREYTTLISSCIGCHRYVRNSRVVSLAPFDSLPSAH